LLFSYKLTYLLK